MNLSQDDYRKFQQVARFTNISDKPFEHTHAFGSAPPMQYRFDPGESRVMPFIVADHLATHLARKMVIDKSAGKGAKYDRPLVNATDEHEMKKHILSDVSHNEPPQQKSRNEILQEEIDRLNETDEQIVNPEGGKVMTKKDVMEELDKRDVKYNARRTKKELQEQLDAVIAQESE